MRSFVTAEERSGQVAKGKIPPLSRRTVRRSHLLLEEMKLSINPTAPPRGGLAGPEAGGEESRGRLKHSGDQRGLLSTEAEGGCTADTQP